MSTYSTELRYPVADGQRLYLLKECLSAEEIRRRKYTGYLPTALVAEVAAFVTEYEPMQDTVRELRGARAGAVDRKKTAVTNLIYYVRDFWEVLERRIRREQQPEALFIFYDQTRSGDNATGNRVADWLDYAADIARGEANVVAQGFSPMTNPSAAAVAVRSEIAKTAVSDVLSTAADLDDAQHIVDAARPQADKLIRIVNANLNLSLYGRKKDDMRGIKRRYGFSFYERTRKTAVSSVDDG